MKNRVLNLMMLCLLALFALSACGVLQEPEAASGAIEAIPLETHSPLPSLSPSASTRKRRRSRTQR